MKTIQEIEEIELLRNEADFYKQNLVKGDKKKNKIHIVYLMVWTKVCGGSKIILEYANYLAKRGHKITIVSYDEKPNWFYLEENIQFIHVNSNDLLENNIPDCDVIVATSWKNIYSAIKANKAPVTFFEQGGAHLFESENLTETKKKAVTIRMSVVPFIHTVSTYAKDIIKKVYKRDSEVIYNAIDSKIFYPRKDLYKMTDKIIITIIGSENFKFKNINESLEAIRIIKQKYNNIDLKWITQEKPCANKEEAIVNPKQKEIGDILRKTDIFICNSEYESFGLPVLEAMTCGAAVITTDTGGTRDFVKDNENALVVEKHNLNDLLSKLEILINNKEKRMDLMRNATETAKKFNWEFSVNTIEKYYKKISEYKINV